MIQKQLQVSLGLLCVVLIIRSLLVTTSHEKYINSSLDDLSVPSNFYDTLQPIPNMYFDEMKGKDFIELFNKHVSASSHTKTYIPIPEDMILPSDKMYVLQATEKIVLDILNSSKNSGHDFKTIASSLLSMYIGKNGKLASVQLLVHRPTKAYGILATYDIYINVETKTISLTKVSLQGFVFEDRLYSALPANLPVHTPSSYVDMINNTILKPQDEEQKELCDHFNKMQKFGNIDYSSLGLNTSCDAKSSSSSS